MYEEGEKSLLSISRLGWGGEEVAAEEVNPDKGPDKGPDDDPDDGMLGRVPFAAGFFDGRALTGGM